MSNAIAGLQPKLFWHYFAALSRIPRPSRHEQQAARFVLQVAEQFGLEAEMDACGNVLVRKPATPGRETVPGICLQSHLDMVCEKNQDKVHDFFQDPIELVRSGPVLMANGTTLGADNGVGVAASLAVLADRNVKHGPLEFLFTVEEEIGLTGALNLTPGMVKSRTLLNLDSEEEGAVYVGCAGGRDSIGTWRPRLEEAPAASVAAVLAVKGLKGGHSGLDIDKGLGNAIKTLNRVVLRLAELGARLSALDGGKMRNAIPRECRGLVYLPKEQVEEAQALVARLEAESRAELQPVDPELVVTMILADPSQAGSVLSLEDQERICQSIAALPSGVIRMSGDIPGLVETSSNVSVVATGASEITLVTSQRSSVATRLDEVAQSVAAIFTLGGAQVQQSDGYPGWKPNLDSPILKTAQGCYRALFDRELKVKAVHAGLECGILGERVPGLDMISFGPTLEAVHSPDEKIYIDSVGKFWAFLVAILEAR
ncbi:aminoacyl-histidine dipeptidase [Geomonas silvestris]|uniref:Cytosol non-specific dipeptidase n=1 Tax=Geomonas silvestris TaxID=2740184 RepID=A0A6V8MMZ6_9BACT|nr:aminoacyl-histidine dipeptidase [Geomonas silvestris]GFO61304.1 aminoacyl-histidine dipeptidase [Geomonas silvestris]